MDALEEESFALSFSSASDTPVFNEYISLVEKYIEEELLERIPGFNMAAFTTTSRHHRAEAAGDVLDMLLTFADFLAFKEMFLDYRAEKQGRGLDLRSGLVVTSLCKSQNVGSLHCANPKSLHQLPRVTCGPGPTARQWDLSGRCQPNSLEEALANVTIHVGKTDPVLQLINVKY
uniref:ADP-ribosylation factor-like protein 2-binding protein n=2 Tax=Canis lupus familiaris TaxID=9615 RepID=A0A8C0M800_CANLF